MICFCFCFCFLEKKKKKDKHHRQHTTRSKNLEDSDGLEFLDATGRVLSARVVFGVAGGSICVVRDFMCFLSLVYFRAYFTYGGIEICQDRR